jgi:hypothetical protein
VNDWQDTFPIHDEVEDCCGTTRRFCISCYPAGLGYTLMAAEEGAIDQGYQFRAYSETSPSSALFRIREKMRRVLSRRDLSMSSALPELLHDRMRGRITSCDEGDVLLVVDGRAVDMGDLARILASYEGWEFELRIRDALE